MNGARAGVPVGWGECVHRLGEARQSLLAPECPTLLLPSQPGQEEMWTDQQRQTGSA